jgi:EAL domain-containing protein (putative c-di-GMP-specific phosphodiesterase class I)
VPRLVEPQASLFDHVSAQQLHTADFVAQVLATVANAGADPQRLGLELTESLLAEHIEDVIDKMIRLKLAGVSFSIDDLRNRRRFAQLPEALPARDAQN